ncbi:MAG TPA: nucleotide synthetase [Allosphingosinicella sp.]|jgi:hypothetical protein
MANPGHSPHKIKVDEPNGYRERRRIWLQLQYELDAKGEPKFSYRVAGASAEEEGLLPDKIDRAAWSRFMPREELVATLDIGIEDDSGVTVETVSKANRVLLWSLGTDAVMTREPRTDFYGELRYWNGGQWLAREDFDESSCARIRFKAKKKAHPPENHKFSYNVIYRDRQGGDIEFEIDPDIKNPSA